MSTISESYRAILESSENSNQQSLTLNKCQILTGDCIEQMRTLPDCSIDAVVTDPPYGLSFMGKKWDYDVPQVDVWREALRVLKPGGHLLAFAGTRTQHRMAVNIEDAGFEIRDMIAWVYGSGFPKSLDVSKAIDKAAGAEREVVGRDPTRYRRDNDNNNTYAAHCGQTGNITAPATDAARAWQGWGTALKPALEPITVARKPFKGTVAANVLKHGTGGINVDGCRVGTDAGWAYPNGRGGSGWHGRESLSANLSEPMAATQGRFPANLIHDGSEDVTGLFPLTGASKAAPRGKAGYFASHADNGEMRGHNDTGSAARFFKCCEKDCPDCLTCAKACDSIASNHEERIALWKNILALNVEKSGWTSQATNEFIARASAIGLANERLVLNVRSAGRLCDLCATSIAVALVGTKTSAFSSEELQAILASTGSCNASILIQNLACFAELWENIDTTPTTQSLSILFGSVRDAIASSTQQESAAVAGRESAPSRFAYIPKASKRDRDEGCEGLKLRGNNRHGEFQGTADHAPKTQEHDKSRNHHPTVKPTDLMRYLCRLVTPPQGTVLDPFMGSGSTGKAAMLEGFSFIGFEIDEEYAAIAKARIKAAINQAIEQQTQNSAQLKLF